MLVIDQLLGINSPIFKIFKIFLRPKLIIIIFTAFGRFLNLIRGTVLFFKFLIRFCANVKKHYQPPSSSLIYRAYTTLTISDYITKNRIDVNSMLLVLIYMFMYIVYILLCNT